MLKERLREKITEDIHEVEVREINKLINELNEPAPTEEVVKEEPTIQTLSGHLRVFLAELENNAGKYEDLQTTAPDKDNALFFRGKAEAYAFSAKSLRGVIEWHGKQPSKQKVSDLEALISEYKRLNSDSENEKLRRYNHEADELNEGLQRRNGELEALVKELTEGLTQTQDVLVHNANISLTHWIFVRTADLIAKAKALIK